MATKARPLYADYLRRHAQDKSLITIAAELGCSRTHVANEYRRLGINRTSQRGVYDWQNVILPRAVEIVESYSTRVTLRQVYYRLVSARLIANEKGTYSYLSRASAQWRREGRFPDLLDTTRVVEIDRGFSGAESALEWLPRVFSMDLAEGQPYSIYLVCEKRGMAAQLRQWFGDKLCLPVVCLGGYASQTLMSAVCSDAAIYEGDEGTIVLYAGDFDPDGIEIERDFKRRTNGAFSEYRRVALDGEQAKELDPNLVGDEDESYGGQAKLERFMDEFGVKDKWELDALDPDELRRLYQEAIDAYWNEDAYQAMLEREQEERERLETLELG